MTVTPFLAVDEYQSLPAGFTLYQNYPNPFNPISTIRFDLKIDEHIKLTVLNVLGQRVATLIDKNMLAGSYRVTWDGTNDRGEVVASGVYVYQLESKGQVQTKKLVLIR